MSGGDLCALADGQNLTILSYLVDLPARPQYSCGHVEKKQKKEQDRFERRFKRSFPISHAQILDEKILRREILRPARELCAYSLLCKQFRDVIANPAHENFLYSGISQSLMNEYLLRDSGPNVEDNMVDLGIFTELFVEKNLEMLHRTGVPVRIQHDNQDPSKGFWYGQTAEGMKTPKNKDFSYSYYFKKPAENVTYSPVTVSDQDRAAFLCLFKTGEKNFEDSFECSLIFQDPRFDFYILMLEGTPKPAIQKYREFAQFIDNKLLLLRSVLAVDGSSPPLPFHDCLEWCNNLQEYLQTEDEDVGEFDEPSMELVLDSIVSWAVNDFKEGCRHYIAKSVLFETGEGGIQGWDNWVIWNGSSEHFVPYMIMGVDDQYWPG
jgi:hypothetical protein